MTISFSIKFQRPNKKQINLHKGAIVCFANSKGKLLSSSKEIDSVTQGVASRVASSEKFKKMELGEVIKIEFPANLESCMLIIIKLDADSPLDAYRKAGAGIAINANRYKTLVLCQGLKHINELVLGTHLRSYCFDRHKEIEDRKDEDFEVVFCVSTPKKEESKYKFNHAVAEGVRLTRDLVNEPANVLTTEEFASRILQLKEFGVDVSILKESELEKIGMRSLLAVGQGARSPSLVGILKWQRGDTDPLALIGKGVVFDTGGISLKPSNNMESMTMDMAGAAAVVGTIQAAAQRQANANLIGLVGLVENMPGGNAQRPGDVVRSYKGDTIEVINTDAEGRMVLADLLWYAQKKYNPSAIIDLATLTGAIIVGLGNQFAGAFSNDDELYYNLQTSSKNTGEKIWRMPLDKSYAKLLKSRIADIKNVGGRGAGAITAAKFLERFVDSSVPWVHLDIAGVALSEKPSELAPSGATGWGVRLLNNLIETRFNKDNE